MSITTRTPTQNDLPLCYIQSLHLPSGGAVVRGDSPRMTILSSFSLFRIDASCAYCTMLVARLHLKAAVEAKAEALISVGRAQSKLFICRL